MLVKPMDSFAHPLQRSNCFLGISLWTRALGNTTCVLLVTTAISGCGRGLPATAPVEGIVLLDGQPVAKASVVFVAKDGGRTGSGETDEDGHFSLTTFETDDGALVGTHSVCVTKREITIVGHEPVAASPDGTSTAMMRLKTHEQWGLPKKYADPQTSGIEVEVVEGMEPLRIELTERETTSAPKR